MGIREGGKRERGGKKGSLGSRSFPHLLLYKIQLQNPLSQHLSQAQVNISSSPQQEPTIRYIYQTRSMIECLHMPKPKKGKKPNSPPSTNKDPWDLSIADPAAVCQKYSKILQEVPKRERGAIARLSTYQGRLLCPIISEKKQSQGFLW